MTPAPGLASWATRQARLATAGLPHRVPLALLGADWPVNPEIGVQRTALARPPENDTEKTSRAEI